MPFRGGHGSWKGDEGNKPLWAQGLQMLLGCTFHVLLRCFLGC